MRKLKEKLYAHCQNWVDEKVKLAKTTIDHAQSSANEETKSSAGDKYETGRAMAQLEIEKGSIQLAEATKLNRLLNEFSVQSESDHIILGSLVQANEEWYYISISAGKVIIDNQSVICLSPVSPLGALMMGLSIGKSYQFNKVIYVIKQVY